MRKTRRPAPTRTTSAPGLRSFRAPATETQPPRTVDPSCLLRRPVVPAEATTGAPCSFTLALPALPSYIQNDLIANYGPQQPTGTHQASTSAPSTSSTSPAENTSAPSLPELDPIEESPESTTAAAAPEPDIPVTYPPPTVTATGPTLPPLDDAAAAPMPVPPAATGRKPRTLNKIIEAADKAAAIAAITKAWGITEDDVLPLPANFEVPARDRAQTSDRSGAANAWVFQRWPGGPNGEMRYQWRNRTGRPSASVYAHFGMDGAKMYRKEGVLEENGERAEGTRPEPGRVDRSLIRVELQEFDSEPKKQNKRPKPDSEAGAKGDGTKKPPAKRSKKTHASATMQAPAAPVASTSAVPYAGPPNDIPVAAVAAAEAPPQPVPTTAQPPAPARRPAAPVRTVAPSSRPQTGHGSQNPTREPAQRPVSVQTPRVDLLAPPLAAQGAMPAAGPSSLPLPTFQAPQPTNWHEIPVQYAAGSTPGPSAPSFAGSFTPSTSYQPVPVQQTTATGERYPATTTTTTHRRHASAHTPLQGSTDPTAAFWDQLLATNLPASSSTNTYAPAATATVDATPRAPAVVRRRLPFQNLRTEQTAQTQPGLPPGLRQRPEWYGSRGADFESAGTALAPAPSQPQPTALQGHPTPSTAAMLHMASQASTSTSSQWSSDYTVTESAYQLFEGCYDADVFRQPTGEDDGF